jgi:hypothetical protein
MTQRFRETKKKQSRRLIEALEAVMPTDLAIIWNSEPQMQT